jgi:hypothetical protein
MAKTDAKLKGIVRKLRTKKSSDYAIERRAATRWADQVMNLMPSGYFERHEWLKTWGLVFDAHLAGLRGKSSPSAGVTS